MSKTPADLVAEAKATIREVSVDEAQAMAADGAAMIDVREPEEVAAGAVSGAIAVPRGVLEFRLSDLPADKNAAVIVYCRSGGRSALATKSLEELGFTNVASMAGGFLAWAEAGKPTT